MVHGDAWGLGCAESCEQRLFLHVCLEHGFMLGIAVSPPPAFCVDFQMFDDVCNMFNLPACGLKQIFVHILTKQYTSEFVKEIMQV